MDNTWLIVGLGNPGKGYELTRHNVGFLFIDFLIDEYHDYVGEGREGGDLQWWPLKMPSLPLCILAKPLTFMNLSGIAVEKLCHLHSIAPPNLLVVHDDLDIELGRMKLVYRGGGAGHRGVLSIISTLKSKDFYRIRIGIGRPSKGEAIRDYVLSPFEEGEIKVLPYILEAAVKGCIIFLRKGLDAGRNLINAFRLP